MDAPSPEVAELAELRHEVQRLRRLVGLLRDGIDGVEGLNDAATAETFEARLTMLLSNAIQQLGMEGAIVLQHDGESLLPVVSLGLPETLAVANAVTDSAFVDAVLRSDQPLQWCHEPGITPLPGLPVWRGVRIHVAGKLAGALVFVARQVPAARDRADDDEVLRLLAKWAGGELARRSVEEDRDRLVRGLQEEGSLMRQVIAGAPVAMAMLDCDLRYIVHSQRLVTDNRLDATDLAGHLHADVFPETMPHWRGPFHRALQGECVSAEEDLLPFADGSPRYLRWVMQPWFDGEGTIGGVILVTEDRTSLVLAREQAVEASRAKSSFLATISHEIRTPMNGVMGMLALLQRTRLDERQQSYLGAIESSAQALLVLLNDILDYARIEAGKLTLQSVEFNLRLLLQDIVSLLTPKAEAKGIALILACPEVLPTRVIGDPGRLRQVVTNLVDNAIKFTETGSVRVGVEVTAESKVDARFRITVRDTGPGISKEQAQLLFRAFSQLDTRATRRGGGTGLGLAICKQLVELAGGRIDVDSSLGEGSTFWFEMPFKKQDMQATEAPRRNTALARMAETQRPLGLRVLVAEDNPINQTVAREYLRHLGCVVTLAENGAEAVDRCREHSYDVVLMDCHMPTMDGFEATRQIRALGGTGGRVPIYAMTASVSPQDQEDCRAAGMNGHFAKPIEIAELHRVLSRLGLRPHSEATEPPTPAIMPASSNEATVGGPLHLDPKRLDLITGGNAELRRTLLTLSQRELLDRVRELEKQVAAGDLAAVASAAHRLKGGAENIGASALGAAAKRLEAAARAGNLHDAQLFVRDVRHAHDRTQIDVASMLGS